MKKAIARFLILTTAFLCLQQPGTVTTAATLTNPARIGSFTYFDMNDDGLNEKIGIFPNISGGILEGYTIRANDVQVLEEKISSKKNCSGIDALTVDTDSKDGYMDLYIAQFNEKGYFDGNVYRYNGKKLKKIYNLKNVMKLSVNPTLAHEQPGNGKIRFCVPGYPVGKNTRLGEYEVYMDFKISDGKISCTDTVYRTTDDYQIKSCLEAHRSFKVYKDQAQKKRSYTIKAGEKFTVTKLVTKKGKIVRLCIKNNAGKTGWVNAPTKKWVK